nr:MAG TPA: hypothetical protein [Caudoviricetes sp.]
MCAFISRNCIQHITHNTGLCVIDERTNDNGTNCITCLQ